MNLFTKVPKDRENMSVNFKETKSDLILGLNNCTDNWCNKYGILKIIPQ